MGLLDPQTVPASQGRSSGLSANTLKAVAMAAMVADHVNKLFVPREMVLLYTLLDLIGYTTAPLLFYLLVEGFHKTGSARRYMLRMAAFAAVSYAPYIFAMQGSWPNRENYMSLNVLVTMLAGLVLLHIRHRMTNRVLAAALILSLFAVTVTSDWSPMGLVYVLVFDYFYGDFPKQAFVYAVLYLTKALSIISDPIYSLVLGLYPFDAGYYIRGLASLGHFLPLLLLYRYNGQKGRAGTAAKWGFYLFYPAHLLILGLISQYLKG